MANEALHFANPNKRIGNRCRSGLWDKVTAISQNPNIVHQISPQIAKLRTPNIKK